ncbi:MAG: hypothetical protein FRX49_12527 [Trebouxia sp. A1-2]|nr:MAG: hypothetical protein FRX49_12527 [Trebouxia sp. A1-2]
MSEPRLEDTEEVIEEIGVEDSSDPSYQLDPALAAKLLSGGAGQGSLISALQGHLEGMIGKPSGLIESLPKTLRNRLAYLGELQDQHDELAEKLHEEQVALQRKYEKLWDPLFQKRAAIVQGKEEAPNALHQKEGDEDKEAEPESDVSGIPDFWMHVLQSHKGWNEEIQDKDIPILSHLVDIRIVNLRDEEDGFKIIFEFSDNPFFSNKELVKTYYMVSDDASDPVLQKATATTIQWASGKNPGVKLQKKKAPKGKSRPPVRSTRVPTFFDFFSPPTVPETESELTEEGMDELQAALEKDYELGELLRDDIIPYAIKWFTGEAQMEDSDEEDLDEEDDEDDEDIAQLVQSAADDEDDEDEEEEESPAKPSLVRGAKKGKPAAARGGADKETPPDCKQQ